ncbi:MAG: orotidine-5'-phosphate decarboxylase [Deltaproteobacteria bacterium]|nr:MAG: orotidine-5'-phosphate decarboxylase [Deltaproteobacteria bacterium]
MISPHERIIFALDVSQRASALEWVERLSGHVGLFKVGLELFVSEGPSLVEEISSRGERVFLDLKFHDIPNTVAGAVRAAASCGPFIMNLHALAGSEAMRRAAEAAKEGAERAGVEPAKLIAVTVLTSHTADTLSELGIQGSPAGAVHRLANLAKDSGIDGVVASPMEAAMVREVWPSGLIVTPGVRPAGSSLDDQSRVATPSGAADSGADYIVVGRPIRNAEDPVAAADAIAEELREASR